jgi:Rod binding domain-containing protein
MSDLSIMDSGQLALQSRQVMPRLGQVDSAAKAEKVAQDFEAVFLSQMLQPMFKDIEPEEPFGGGQGEDIWKSMMIDEIGKQMAKNGGIGLAASVKREILRMQESQHNNVQQEVKQ